MKLRMVSRGFFSEPLDVLTYSRKRNVAMVSVMATREMDTPTYPMTCRDSVIARLVLRGAALSNMAKCVRWVHSHTVTEQLERSSFLEQPLSDHWPMLKRELLGL